MAKKNRDPELFSIAFLDLLSGAFAAVLILFILIPKQKREEKLAAEALAKFNLSIEQLDTLVKNTVDKDVYDEVSVQLTAIKLKLKTLADEIALLEAENRQYEDAVPVLRNQYEDLLNQLDKALADLENCRDEKGSIGEQLTALEDQMGDFKAYYEWMKKCNFDVNGDCPKASDGFSKDLDVGFKFKGKNIVFVIDVSGSMVENDYKEDRLEPLKGGLKMLITTLDESYKFDMVAFPKWGNKECDNFFAKWGYLAAATDSSKADAYRTVFSLKAGGGTPTRATLRYVLETYDDVTDIILFSDGKPTNNCYTLINQGAKEENINSVIDDITILNSGRVKISCVGVGRDFYEKPTSDFVMFLKELSSRNDGFFVGF